MYLFFQFSFLCFWNLGHSHSILDYGAVPNDPSNKAGWTNTLAIQSCLRAANQPGNDRLCFIPEDKKFYIFNAEVSQLHNITMQIDGTLVISNNITEWPKKENGSRLAGLSFFGLSQHPDRR